MSGDVLQILGYMEVGGSDGEHVGTVDKAEGDRIKLTRQDGPNRSGQHHHSLPVGSIVAVGGNRARPGIPGRQAREPAALPESGASPPGMGQGWPAEPLPRSAVQGSERFGSAGRAAEWARRRRPGQRPADRRRCVAPA